jgi:hypothetical protein
MDTSVVQWVLYDNKLKEYAEKSKKLRQERDIVSQNIIDSLAIPDPGPEGPGGGTEGPGTEGPVLPQYSIESLNTKVLCHQSKTYDSLNYRFLTECLKDYFKDKLDVHGQSETDAITADILQHIRSKRKITTKIILKRDIITHISEGS